MRKAIGVWILGGLTAVGMIGGCADEAADQHANAMAAFEQAADLLDQANQGYVPRGEDQGEAFTIGDQTYHWPDLAGRRARLLVDAIDQLQSPAIRSASPQMRSTVQELLSLAYAMQAQAAQKQAVGAYSRFAADSGALIAQALALSIARQRDSLFQVEYEPVIATYEEHERSERAEAGELDGANQAMRQRLDRLETQAKQSQAKRDELMAQVGRLRQDSFLAQGDRYFELLDRAARLEVQADELLAEAQKYQTTSDVLEAELTISQTRREQAEASAEVMKSQAELMSQMRELAREQRAAAQQAQAALNQELMGLLEQFSTRFEQEVEDAFATAAEYIDQAVDAASGAGRSARQILVDRYLAQASMAAERIIAEGSFARTLSLAVEAAGEGSQAASVFNDKIDRLEQQQNEHAQRATQALDEITPEIAEGEEASPEEARLLGRIETLRELISEALINPAPAEETPAEEAGDAATQESGSAGGSD